MQRIFAALAMFGGWLSILVGVAFGLVATQLLGLDHTEGDFPAAGLYGVPAVLVMWFAIAAAMVAAVPVGAAMFAPDPSRRMYVAAAIMGAIGLAILPEELGRAYAAAILPGAGLLALGGWWAKKAGAIGAQPAASAGTIPGATAPEPEPGYAPEPKPGSAPEASLLASSTGGGATGTGLAAPVSTPAGNTKKTTARRSKRAPAQAQTAPDVACPWCSAQIPAGSEVCPICGAALTSSTLEVAIPGVTAVDPELREYEAKVAGRKKRPSLLSLVLSEPEGKLFAAGQEPVDSLALRPPSAEVRAEMERIDREIATLAHPAENADRAAPDDAEPGSAAPAPSGGVWSAAPSGAPVAPRPAAVAAEDGPARDPRARSDTER